MTQDINNLLNTKKALLESLIGKQVPIKKVRRKYTGSGRFKDLTGQEFNGIKCLEFLYFNEKHHGSVYKWQCACGKEFQALVGNIKSGRQKTCGCLTGLNLERPQKRIPIQEGQVFGYLTVLKLEGKLKNKTLTYRCVCTCGNEIIARSTRLGGQTTDCGCKFGEKITAANTVHGGSFKDSVHPLYKCWDGIKDRTTRPKCPAYRGYGGRGITICEEWLIDYQNFYNWAMDNGWKQGLSIERIDVNGNYCPENCTWITMREQATNKRNTIKIGYNGEQIAPAKVWLSFKDKSPNNYSLFLSRLLAGWTIEEAAMTPKNGKKK